MDLKQASLLDAVIDKNYLKNDAALGRFLKVASPVISKIRAGILPVGASFILKIHEIDGMSVEKIRSYLKGAK